MNKNLLKRQNGFVGADAYIAIIIAALASALVTVLVYNIYIAASRAKRDSQATAYIVELFEYIDKELYGNVTEDNLVKYINEKYNTGDKKIASAKAINGENTELSTPYKLEIEIIPYSNEFDLVKTVEVEIKYNVGLKEETISMKKIKSRENLITPNKPEIEILDFAEGIYCYPVKYINNNWYVTNENDTTWYNYQNKQWATVFISTDILQEKDIINSEVIGTYKIWSPKYAYNNLDNSQILFIYQNTNCYVQNGDLQEINIDNYTIASEGWISVENITAQSLYNDYFILYNAIGRLNICE